MCSEKRNNYDYLQLESRLLNCYAYRLVLLKRCCYVRKLNIVKSLQHPMQTHACMYMAQEVPETHKSVRSN